MQVARLPAIHSFSRTLRFLVVSFFIYLPLRKMRKFFTQKFHLIFYTSLLVISVFVFRLIHLDFIVSDFFFFRSSGWVSTDRAFWGIVYKHFTSPCIFLVYFSVLAFFYSRLITKRHTTRWKAICVVVAIVVGPGLIINGILKPMIGRPRPTDIVRYGGVDQYVPLLHISDKGESFPSGHAASGFALTILFYIYYRSKKRLAWVCWFGGMSIGILLSYARLAQGGHFVSDCIWSMGLTQIVNSIAYFNLESRIQTKQFILAGTFQTSRTPQKVAFSLMATVLTGIFGIGYLISFPFTFFTAGHSNVPNDVTKIIVDAPLEKEDVKLFSSSERNIGFDHLVFAHGFPWSTVTPITLVSFQRTTMTYQIRILQKGAFRGYRGRMKLFLPRGVEVDLNSIQGDIVEDSRKSTQ